MSLMVKTFTPECRSRRRSSSSSDRTPTSTVWSSRSDGVGQLSDTKAGPAHPSAAASGMPCTLPVGLVSGVLASAWASTQMTGAGAVDPGQAAQHAHGQGVVPAQDEGEVGLGRLGHGVGDLAAGGQDLGQVLGVRVLDVERLHLPHGHVAEVGDAESRAPRCARPDRRSGSPKGPCRRRGGPARGRGRRR